MIDLSKRQLLASAAVLAAASQTANGQTCTQPCFPQTSEESDAGVTPSDLQYPPGNILRYGTNTVPGTTDMTSAAQAAADIGLLHVPHGTFLIAQVLLPSSCLVIGDGDRSILKTTTNTTMLFAENKSEVHVRNLKFVGNSTGTSQHGVALEGVSDGSIVGCTFVNISGRPVRLAWDGNDSVPTQRIVVAHNNMRNSGDVAIFLKTSVYDCVIAHNIIDGVGIGGTADFCIGINIDDGSTTDAFDAAPCKRIIIAHNILRGLRGGSTSRGINVTGSIDIDVLFNTLEDIGATGEVGMPGIYLHNGGLTPDLGNERIRVIGNRLIDIADDAIRINRSSSCVIKDNFIQNYGANTSSMNVSGIELTSAVDDSEVVGNHIIAGANSNFGINISSTSCDNNFVLHNIINANGVAIADIQDVGTGTIRIEPTSAGTFLASDTTPSVKGRSVWLTHTGAITITDFDDGSAGQEITVISKGAITFDVTGTDLKGGTADLVTATGDVTRWVCENGTDWRLVGFVDASVDNSGGA